MAINKVIRKGVVALDLTSDSVTPETLISGTTAHNAAGESIVGTASSGIDTTDATATAADMLSGKTAYAKGEKITGTFTIDSELTTQDNLISQIQTALQNKAAGGVSVETSEVTIAASVFPTNVYYSPILGEAVIWSADEPGAYAQFECVKGTIICFHGNKNSGLTYVGCEYIGSGIVLITESVARIE